MSEVVPISKRLDTNVDFEFETYITTYDPMTSGINLLCTALNSTRKAVRLLLTI